MVAAGIVTLAVGAVAMALTTAAGDASDSVELAAVALVLVGMTLMLVAPT